MTPGLIIFDCDGVLVDSEPLTNAMMAREMTTAGLPMTTREAMDNFVGGTIRGVFEKARGLGARLPDDWVDGFYDRMIAMLAREVELIPGAADVLSCLEAEDIAHCIASNGPMRKMAATLGRHGLWARLETRAFSAHEVGIAKPDPGLFLHAARAMGATPDTCVVIEDSASGARAAQAAGMRCYGFTRDTPAERLTAQGAIPFADLAELPSLLGLT